MPHYQPVHEISEDDGAVGFLISFSVSSFPPSIFCMRRIGRENTPFVLLPHVVADSQNEIGPSPLLLHQRLPRLG
jgi:hypothetical protein